MGEPQTPHFYDFGIWGRVQTPQNQLLFIFGDTGIPKINQEMHGAFFKRIFQKNLKVWESNDDNFRRGRHRK